MRISMSLSLIVAGLLASSTAAQRSDVKVFPGPLNTSFAGKIVLLIQSDDVRKELKLSREQAGKLKDLADEQRNAYKDLPKDNAERAKKVQDIARQNLNRDKKVAAILTPEQIKRVDQILLQHQGANLLTHPKLVEQFKLNDDQKRQVTQAVQESMKRLDPYFRPDNVSPEEIQKGMAENRVKSMERIATILTLEQHKMRKEMVGEPFKGVFGVTAINRK